ncbi:MAG: 30S ribosomal protein S1 [Rickettsiales bacterium]|nr:30S ribosomal protein S1 [Rickettsiales bacterium]OUV81002.1 MAG: 30S ribosomal protein S1 [Rickettsiales bacterium TMED131]
MSVKASDINIKASKENFAELLEESFSKETKKVGGLVKGKVVAIEKESAVIDIGYKSEGRVPIKEFTPPDKKPQLGDEVEVFFEHAENKFGDAVLSRERAKRETAWEVMEKALKNKDQVKGSIFSRVKGGFSVDLNDAIAFLPGSQVDVKVIKDNSYLLGTEQIFHILKMDRKRGNIVVSRRSVLEEGRAEAKKEMASTLEEGQIMEGTVKNITDYGAFVDLGEMDGLLHVTDISWKRISHPSELLSVGKKIKVKLIKYNSDSQRLSLGMKQLNEDPWKGADQKFKLGNKYKGVVTNIADYGAFVEIDKGIEGLVHVSEMSWNKKNTNPFKIVNSGDEVEVVILDFDMEKRRLSLGMKQAIQSPWDEIKKSLKVDTIHEGEITNITEFGLFIKVTDDVDGLVHINDLSWKNSVEEELKKYQKGMSVKSKVLELDAEKERIALGIKQLEKDPFESIVTGKLKKGSLVTCVIENVLDAGLEVKLENDILGFIKKADLSRDKEEQKASRFAKGEKVDAMVSSIDKSSRKLYLSIKSMELAEEKKAMKDYGSTDSGASLGDILGAALEAKSDKKKKDDTVSKKK